MKLTVVSASVTVNRTAMPSQLRIQFLRTSSLRHGADLELYQTVACNPPLDSIPVTVQWRSRRYPDTLIRQPHWIPPSSTSMPDSDGKYPKVARETLEILDELEDRGER